MKSIEEQLQDATAKVEALEVEAKASAELLSESQEKVAASEKVAEDLKTELEKATSNLSVLETEAKAEIEAKQAEIEAAKAELESAKAEIASRCEEIEKLKADAKTAEQVAAERYGAGNDPAKVSADAVAEGTPELVAKFQAISNPSEQTVFWRGLSDAQKMALLKATKGA